MIRRFTPHQPALAGLLTGGLLLVACSAPASAPPTQVPAAPPPAQAATPAPPAAAASPASLKVQLSWLKDAQSAGEFEALAKGYYKAENLDVELMAGGPSINNVQTVAGGQGQIGIVGSPTSLLLARTQNIPVRIFGVTDDKSPYALTCRPEANIKRFSDLKGKTVGATQPQRVNLQALLAINGLTTDDVTIADAGADLTSLIAGRIDCRVTNVNSEPIALRAQGINPDVLLAYDNGLKQQGDYFFALDDTIAKDPSVMTRFLRATIKGWTDALSNVNDGVAVTKQNVPDLDTDLAAAELNALKPLMMTDRTASAGLLSADPESMAAVLRVLSQAGQIPNTMTTNDILNQTLYPKP
jgi:NitT/TauT family transport system substrate-binding protein